MTYMLNSEELDPNADQFVHALQNAWSSKQRLLCTCSSQSPSMYVARVSDQFIIKRMPGTGHLHSSGCVSYMPPAGISGLSQVLDSAIQQSELDDVTYLRLDFPLSQSGKRPPMPPPSGEAATEALAPPKKLSLTGLLHYLWHEANLVKWNQKFTGKRWWGKVQNNLSNAAHGMVAKNNNLAERLYIPGPWKPELKAARAGERAASFAKLKAASGSTTQLGMLIAEYKAHEPARFGSKFTFKHMPDCSFFADMDLVDRFERVFEGALEMNSMVEGSHLIVIATYSLSKTGFPLLNQIAGMPVTKNWIPFEHMNDVALLDHLDGEDRAYIKTLRYNLPKSEQIASVMLTDCEIPVACFIGDQISEEAKDQDFPTWLWSGDTTIPDLPISSQEFASEFNGILNQYRKDDQ